jgi:hypothetical protein
MIVASIVCERSAVDLSLPFDFLGPREWQRRLDIIGDESRRLARADDVRIRASSPDALTMAAARPIGNILCPLLPKLLPNQLGQVGEETDEERHGTQIS